MDERRFFLKPAVTDEIVAGDERLRFGQSGVVIVMNCGQRFGFFHAVADALVEFEPDAMIDLVFLFLAAAAEDGQRDAKLLAVGASDVAAARTRYIGMEPCLPQALRLINHAFVAPLQTNPLPKFFQGLTGGNHRFREPAAFLETRRSFA